MSEEVARPVVDAAKTESRNQQIVAALVGLIVFIPEVLISFDLWEVTDMQVLDLTRLVNLIAVVVLLFIAQQTKTNALFVETQVTSTFDPVKTTTVGV